MLPDFEETGDLPPGVHEAAWDEFVERFGMTDRRRRLIDGLRRALLSLQGAGCTRAYLDGSFVGNKEDPEDFDGCWESAGVDPDVLDPVLLDFSAGRRAQKERYGGELFPAEQAADPDGNSFLEFFQMDRDGNAKGIVAIDLGDLK